MYIINAVAMQPTRKNVNKLGLLGFNMILLAAILIFGVTYLILINSLSTKGYEIRQLEQRIKSAETQHKHLEVQSSNLQSITRIQQEAGRLNLVPIEKTVLIRHPDFALK